MCYLVDPRGRGSVVGVFMGKGLIAALRSPDASNCQDDVGLLCEGNCDGVARVRAIRPVSCILNCSVLKSFFDLPKYIMMARWKLADDGEKWWTCGY